jgi:hypothetical protein
MSDLLVKVLGRVKVKKPVSGKKSGKMIAYLNTDGINVQVISGGKKLIEYTAQAYPDNKNFTVVTLPDWKQPVLVNVPGFENNLADLISLKELDWKDRVIFSNSFRSLLSVEIDYPGSEDLKIKFDQGNFYVTGVASPDSSKLFNFLSRFQHFRVGAFLNEKEDLIIDSLKLSKPFCTIAVTDIDPERSRKITLFSFKDKQPLIYGKTEWSSEYFLIPVQYIRPLLMRKTDFLK